MRISPLIALLLAAGLVGAGEQPVPSPHVVEPTLLFEWQALVVGADGPDPARIEGRTILPSQVRHACAGLNARPTDRLVYRPRSGRCSLASRQSAPARWSRRQAVDAVRSMAATTLEPYERAEKGNDDAEWQWLAPLRSKGLCACDLPTNTAPVATLDDGGAQTVLIGTPIAPIVFSGADGTTNNISGSFQWRLGGGVLQGGLPAGLSSACSPDVGTVICTVTGDAPAPAGTYQLVFQVFDGQLSNTTSTTLVSIPQLIFRSGFESN